LTVLKIIALPQASQKMMGGPSSDDLRSLKSGRWDYLKT
jgi:hypothetical protein